MRRARMLRVALLVAHGRVGHRLARAAAAVRRRARARDHVAAHGRCGGGRGRAVRGGGGDLHAALVAARRAAPGGDGRLDGPARRGDGRRRRSPRTGTTRWWEWHLLMLARVRPRRLGCAAVVARGALRRPLHGRHRRRAARDDDPLRRPQGLHDLLRGARPGGGDRDAQRLLHGRDPRRRQAARRHDRPPHRRRDHGDLQPSRRPAGPRAPSRAGRSGPPGRDGAHRRRAPRLAPVPGRDQQRRGARQRARRRGWPHPHRHRRRRQRRLPHRGPGAGRTASRSPPTPWRCSPARPPSRSVRSSSRARTSPSRPSSSCRWRTRPRDRAVAQGVAGGTLWLRWKMLSGSWVASTAASRP